MEEKLLLDISQKIMSMLEERVGKNIDRSKEKIKKEKVYDEIISQIETNIKTEYEQEFVKDKIYREKNRIKQKSFLYDEVGKEKFVKEFFQEHKELSVIGSTAIKDTIYACLDRINELYRSVISEEGEIIISVVRQEGDKQVNELSSKITQNNKIIADKIDKLHSDLSHVERIKSCCGYGNRKGKCDNPVIKKEGYCMECLQLEYFDNILKLYEVQGYEIEVEDISFIATSRVGIMEAKAIVFPLYGVIGVTNSAFIMDILGEINSINDWKKYQFIHVVSNGNINAQNKKLLQDCGAEIIYDKNIINRIKDFTPYLEREIEQYNRSEISEHYIEAYTEYPKELLKDSVENFLDNSTKNVYLILGDYGCGKTSFLLNLTYHLAKAYLNEEGEYIPLYIQLREYTKAIDFDNLFYNFFTKICKIKNASVDAFNYLQKHKKFVILFDGFDEVAKRVNYDVKYDVFSQICKSAVGNTKIILTSRPNYFQETCEYKKLIESTYIQFEPVDINSIRFQEAFIADLNRKQIKEYISSFKKDLDKLNLKTKDIELIIKTTHDLTDLSRRPFLLNIIIKTLPEILRDIRNNDNFNMKVSAGELYKRYTDLWLERENNKGKTLISSKDKLLFCKYLAYKMFKDDELYVHFTKVPVEIREYFSNITNMDEIDYFSQDIQSCSFLNSDGWGNFKFIHKSFMEYFVACVIVDNLREIENGKEIMMLNHALDIPNISTEIALFINDILDMNSVQKENIVGILERAVEDTDLYVRVNILTILAKTKLNMAKIIVDSGDYKMSDFSQATISDVEIRNADFSQATFYGALIENVKFVNCVFRETSFQKSTLLNVDFSEQTLEYANLTYCNISKCNFSKSSLGDVQMSKSTVTKCDFANCDMSGIDVSETILKNNFNYDNALGVPYQIQ